MERQPSLKSYRRFGRRRAICPGPGLIPPLKEGQAVKVMAGPFVDLVGQLEGLNDNGRVRVLLKILGGKVRVALPQKLIAPTKDVA